MKPVPAPMPQFWPMRLQRLRMAGVNQRVPVRGTSLEMPCAQANLHAFNRLQTTPSFGFMLARVLR
jgi:hypothetical protein